MKYIVVDTHKWIICYSTSDLMMADKYVQQMIEMHQNQGTVPTKYQVYQTLKER